MQAVAYMYKCMYVLATANLTSMSPTRMYIVADIADKGKGLVATVDIPKGTRIIGETPILISDERVPNTPTYLKHLDTHLFKQIYALSEDQKRGIISMSNIYPILTMERCIAASCGPMRYHVDQICPLGPVFPSMSHQSRLR